ncbi:PapD-like protein [Mortierella sp. GBAus27b]|nr:Motile sperm domain-containing protein 2 [Mortierella sp. GBA43]KAI8352236.1 PapD-like protein [Mortierella sp. GBAus27b]
MTASTGSATSAATPSSVSSANSPAPALLRISPQIFQFTASKVSSGLVSKLKIRNLLDTPVGYKFKTNAPQRYSVKPVLGVLAPGKSIDIFVRCENWVNPQDRFLLQSVALEEDESKRIDATTWREIDRRRIVENFIQCSSSSTLSLSDPQDDNGTLSSSSNTSSTRSGSSVQSEKARLQQLYQQQRLSVAHVHAAGRKLSTSSMGSPASSPGSYPAAGSRLMSAQNSKVSSTLVKVLSIVISYVATKLNDLRQTLKTVSRFLAVRHYTMTQVLTVSAVFLLLGLLLPMEKLFMPSNGGSYSTIKTTTAGNGGSRITTTTTAEFRGAVVEQKAIYSSSTPSAASPSDILPILVATARAAANGEGKVDGSIVEPDLGEILSQHADPQDVWQEERVVSPIEGDNAL